MSQGTLLLWGFEPCQGVHGKRLLLRRIGQWHVNKKAALRVLAWVFAVKRRNRFENSSRTKLCIVGIREHRSAAVPANRDIGLEAVADLYQPVFVAGGVGIRGGEDLATRQSRHGSIFTHEGATDLTGGSDSIRNIIITVR